MQYPAGSIASASKQSPVQVMDDSGSPEFLWSFDGQSKRKRDIWLQFDQMTEIQSAAWCWWISSERAYWVFSRAWHGLQNRLSLVIAFPPVDELFSAIYFVDAEDCRLTLIRYCWDCFGDVTWRSKVSAGLGKPGYLIVQLDREPVPVRYIYKYGSLLGSQHDIIKLRRHNAFFSAFFCLIPKGFSRRHSILTYVGKYELEYTLRFLQVRT